MHARLKIRRQPQIPNDDLQAAEMREHGPGARCARRHPQPRKVAVRAPRPKLEQRIESAAVLSRQRRG